MPRVVPRTIPSRRSQRWMQLFANEQSGIINHAIRTSAGLNANVTIDWRSPLADDEYAEYYDQDFLSRLGISPSQVALNAFWPDSGPRWDGLAMTSGNEVILVEAKANLTEFATDPCGAESQKSLDLISQSLADVQRFMEISQKRSRPELWMNAFYQYTNRIAHLYYLRELNDIPTHLIFLDIINDPDSGDDAVRSTDEWKSLVRLAEACLGISRGKPLMKHVHHIHIDVADL